MYTGSRHCWRDCWWFANLPATFMDAAAVVDMVAAAAVIFAGVFVQNVSRSSTPPSPPFCVPGSYARHRYSNSYDLILRGQEICSGAQR